MPDRFEQRRIEGEIANSSSASTDPFASAVRATRMPMLITDPTKPDNPIVFVNDAFFKLTGYTREEVLHRNCRFLQGPGTSLDDIAKIRDGVAKREPVETDILNYRKDGTAFWNRVLISPVYDEEGVLAFFFASQFDVTPERNRLDEVQRDRASLEIEIERRLIDLSRSEERLSFTLRAARLGAWTLDLSTMRLVASARCKQNFGREPTDTYTFQDMVDAIHPDDVKRWHETVNEALAEESGELKIDYRAITPSGDTRWVEVRGQVSRDVTGAAITVAGVSIDITDRKQAEEHRDLLTRELDHRVKNTLANVQSIVTQTLRVAPSLEEGARMLTSRIQALAAAHDVLVKEAWATANLHDLVAGALSPFENDGHKRLRITGPKVHLRMRVATTMTLAIHELATNAAKYGALSNDTGFVELAWGVDGPNNDTFKLVWREIDGPSVVAPTRRGFGSRILERALPAEMGGTTTLQYGASGVSFILEAGLSSIVADGTD